jgi:hypothetical protein
MELDQQAAMKSKTGIGRLIRNEETQELARPRKKRGAGETVGITLKLSPTYWRALHQEAMDEQTNITQLILGWLEESRRRKGLPPIEP